MTWIAPDPDDGWAPDLLGPDYQARTIGLAPDGEGDVVATLVRHSPPAPEPTRPVRVVLYVHGWNDYFFQTELAEFWHDQHVAFYALDLRKYGRSLRAHQTPNYITSLRTYDEEIEAAFDVVRAEHGPDATILIMAHSTGGLIASLWAERHPGEISALVLNSPWLELAGASFVRSLVTPWISTLARTQPTAILPNIDPGHYARTILKRHGGSWEYDEAWRPSPMFPTRPGWIQAILGGHQQVARGLGLQVPVLTALSTTSILQPRWSEEMRSADTVLDVTVIARRAVQLGHLVTVVRIPDGLHDLTLSAPEPRQLFYREIARWTTAYGWN